MAQDNKPTVLSDWLAAERELTEALAATGQETGTAVPTPDQVTTVPADIQGERKRKRAGA